MAFPETRTLGITVLGAVVATAIAMAPAPTIAAQQDFGTWLKGLELEARAKGISAGTVAAALKDVNPIPRVIELDRFQPEFTQTFWGYLNKRVTKKRIARGRDLLARHGKLLRRVEKQYGVQPRFLVSFWALESNFGDYTGTFPLFGALATLAHDERRDAFFRAQLLAALRIMDRGDLDAGVKASWAGAMGQCQFIPTTYLDHAVDFDGDGRRDLWKSLPDVFGSAARYLSRAGWQGDRTWGREVRLPQGFDFEMAGLGLRKPLAEWQRLGLRRIDGRDLPRVDIEGSVILPAGHKGPAFIVYKNFRTILVWNRSILYAIAVGHLADRIVGKGPFKTPRPAQDKALSRADVVQIQVKLAALGLDPGGTDGIVGSRTRKAIKAYQRNNGMPPDGYADAELLRRLNGGNGN